MIQDLQSSNRSRERAISSNVFDKPHLNTFQKFIIRSLPNLFIEDFNLNRTGVPDGIYCLP
jgi:hypothetical protein